MGDRIEDRVDPDNAERFLLISAERDLNDPEFWVLVELTYFDGLEERHLITTIDPEVECTNPELVAFFDHVADGIRAQFEDMAQHGFVDGPAAEEMTIETGLFYAIQQQVAPEAAAQVGDARIDAAPDCTLEGAHYECD